MIFYQGKANEIKLCYWPYLVIFAHRFWSLGAKYTDNTIRGKIHLHHHFVDSVCCRCSHWNTVPTPSWWKSRGCTHKFSELKIQLAMFIMSTVIQRSLKALTFVVFVTFSILLPDGLAWFCARFLSNVTASPQFRFKLSQIDRNVWAAGIKKIKLTYAS